MKKKLLSLVLAGAMVASTSVSAFATTQEVITDGGNANVEITGKVANDQGNLPAGTLRVSIPTTATFMVTKEGVLEGTTITVRNEGDQNIDVYAEEFIDRTKEDGAGITVVQESALKDKKRTYVSLNLQGIYGSVYLKTENVDSNKKGLYKKRDLIDEATNDDLKLTSLTPGQSEGLKLQGNAGEKNDSSQPEQQVGKAVSDNFTLTLKIKKSATS